MSLLTPELLIDATNTPAEQEAAAWEHWGSALTRALRTMRRSDWARSTLAWHIWRAANEALTDEEQLLVFLRPELISRTAQQKRRTRLPRPR